MMSGPPKARWITDDMPRMNGLTFTGVTINGRLAIVSDVLPIKDCKGNMIHLYEMPAQFNPLTKNMEHTVIMSEESFGEMMEMVTEDNKVHALTKH